MGRFTVDDLLKTSVPGMAKFQVPSDTHRKNLEHLIKNILDPMYEEIGPFDIEAGWRSEELQNYFGTATGISFHELGLAADIRPKMGSDAFIGKVLSRPDIRARLGEIIKNSSGVVHVSAARADKTYPVRYKNSEGKYVAFTKEQLDELVKKYGAPLAVGLGSLVVVFGLLYLANRGA